MKSTIGLGLYPANRQPGVPANPDLANFTGLSGLNSYWDARYSEKTYASGLSVSSIAPQAGSNAYKTIEGANPEYDSALFGGQGGLKATATTTIFGTDSAFAAGQNHTVGYVISIPSSAHLSTLHAFAFSSNVGSSFSRIYMNNSSITYARNEASGFPVLKTSATGSSHILVFRYNGSGSLEVYVNSLNPAVTFDPHNDYITLPRLHLFALSGTVQAAVGMAYGAFFHTASTLSDAQIETIISGWSARFSIAVA